MNPYHVMTLTRHKSVRRYTKAADQAAAEAFYETIHKGDLIAAALNRNHHNDKQTSRTKV